MSGRWNQTKKQPGQQTKVQLVTPQLAQWRETFLAGVATPLFFEAIFDHMPDVVFSVKDRDGRVRQGLRKQIKDTVKLGRWLDQVEEQVLDNLDLTLFKDRQPGWCLTHKTPILNAAGEVIGLACLSKDLQEPSRTGGVDGRLAQAVDLIQANYAQVLRVEDAAAQRLTSGAEAITDFAISCGFFDQSALTRHFRQITGLTPGQYRKLAAR